MSDVDEYQYFLNSLPDNTYVSRRLADGTRITKKIMIVENDVYEAQTLLYATLHRGPREKYQIVAKFRGDDRQIRTITLQRYSIVSGRPTERHFTFTGAEIPALLGFLQRIVTVHFPDAASINVPDENLRTIVATSEQVRMLLDEHAALVAQFVENEITERDVVARGYRKNQLKHFEQLPADDNYFKAAMAGKFGPEAVWQDFFERNEWIFGYGLSFVFTSSLDADGLERVVQGHSIATEGRRPDAILRTRAEISSMCFVEIKRHDRPLLANEYRNGVWPPAPDLVGGIAQ